MYVLIPLLVSFLFAVIGAELLRHILGEKTDGSILISGWALTAAITGYIFMILGLLHQLNSTASTIYLILLFILSLILSKGHYPFGRFFVFGGYSSTGKDIRIFFILIVMVLSISFLGALAPPSHLDVLNYHFALLRQCLQSHSLIFNPTFFYGATPFNAEMLSGFMALLSDLRGGQFIQFIAGLLLVVSVFAVGKKHFNLLTAIIASSIFVSTLFLPAILSEAKNDQLLALLSFWAFYYFARAQIESDGRALIVGAVFGGLAGGMKLYGLGIPSIGFLFIIFSAIGGKTKIDYRRIALAGAISLILILPWYIRSLILTGNPIHPFLSNLFGDRYWDSVLNFKFNLMREWRYVRVNPLQFLISPFRVTFDADAYFARIGPIYLSLLPAAILFGGKNKLLKFFGWASLIYFILWFFILHDARYLLPILPGLSLFCAYGAVRLYNSGGYYRLLISGIIIINLLMVLFIDFRSQYQKFPVVLHLESTDEFYRDLREVNKENLESGEYVKAIPEYDFLQKVNRITRETDTVGLFSYNEPFIYYFIDCKLYLLLPLWQNAFDFKSIDNKDDLRTKLNSLGITYIITDTDDDKTVPQNALLKQYDEFGSTLKGTNIFLNFLNSDCEEIVSEGRYRCFRCK